METRPLVVCEGCGRHVRRDATCCPFCKCKSSSLVRGALVAAAFFGTAAIPGCAYGPPPDDDTSQDGVTEVQADVQGDLADE